MVNVPRRHEVLLTRGAEQDLESIHDYIAEHDGMQRADHVLEQLIQTVQGLELFPERGSYPRELLALGIRQYRQTMFKPWRVIYRVMNEQVIVYLVADGRRDMQAVLARRLLSV